MDYFGARYYGHTQYRFLSVDPVINKDDAIENPQLWNLYAYCRNNPITYLDPDGRLSIVSTWGPAFAKKVNARVGSFIDYSWLPKPIKGLVKGLLHLPETADEAAMDFSLSGGVGLAGMIESGGARAGKPGLEFLKKLGRKGRGRRVREVAGTVDDAKALFDQIRGKNPILEVKPGVFTSKIGGGGTVSFRPTSKSGPPTIELPISLIGVKKIKFIK